MAKPLIMVSKSQELVDSVRANPYAYLVDQIGCCQHPTCTEEAAERPVVAHIPGRRGGWVFHLCRAHLEEFAVWCASQGTQPPQH